MNKEIILTNDEFSKLVEVVGEVRNGTLSLNDSYGLIEAQLINAFNKGYQERCFPTN